MYAFSGMGTESPDSIATCTACSCTDHSDPISGTVHSLYNIKYSGRNASAIHTINHAQVFLKTTANASIVLIIPQIIPPLRI